MRRYYASAGFLDAEMVATPEGNWVHHEEAEAELAALRIQLDEVRQAFMEYGAHQHGTCIGVICTCGFIDTIKAFKSPTPARPVVGWTRRRLSS